MMAAGVAAGAAEAAVAVFFMEGVLQWRLPACSFEDTDAGSFEGTDAGSFDGTDAGSFEGTSAGSFEGVGSGSVGRYRAAARSHATTVC
jgi:hypothetical protein